MTRTLRPAPIVWLREGDAQARAVETKSGRVMTEDDIERLATMVDQDFDLSAWRPRRGRPPVDAADEAHAPRIAVRVPGDVHRPEAMMAARRPSREVGVPTVFRSGLYRFHFHSREHEPPHVHVESSGGTAVFGLSPVLLHRRKSYTPRQLEQIERLVIDHRREFLRRWHEHFNQ